MARRSEVYEKFGYNISELYHYIRDSRIIEELKDAAAYSRKIEDLEADLRILKKKIDDKHHLYKTTHDKENRYNIARETSHLSREWRTKMQNLHYLKRHLKRARVKKSLVELKKKFGRALKFR